ncbi:MAG TPA: hypothetical protein ENI97_00705 [Gammaproteobacteria bacterium]|nr:hypothetical protein [Gammaproteobacteria bacterium]
MNNTAPHAPDSIHVLVDAHVHVYPMYDVPAFLDAAWNNFQKAGARLAMREPFLGVLLLSETSACDWFLRQRELAQKKPSLNDEHQWRFEVLEDEHMSLMARRGNKQLVIIGGRQVISAEGLEVLALFTDRHFTDGMALPDLLGKISEAGALPVLPWAVGKWLGERGRVVSSALNKYQSSYNLLLGDNGGRPVFWRRISHFQAARKAGVHILPGSDPLPLKDDACRVGNFGFALPAPVSSSRPAEDIFRLLQNKQTELRPFGRLQGPFQFFRNQLALRFSHPSTVVSETS